MAEVDEEAVEEPTIEAPEDEVDPAPEVPDPAPESDTDEAAEDDSAATDVIDDAVGGETAEDAGLDTAEDVALSDADHLEVPLGEGTVDGELASKELGVAEALQAWSDDGHAEAEFDDSEDIAPVQFAQLDAHPVKPVTREDRLHNVTVKIVVELGRKYMTVSELLKLKEQDCIEIEKLAGEAFDILINKRAFAEGEIVVVTDVMAVRITRLRDSGESGEARE